MVIISVIQTIIVLSVFGGLVFVTTSIATLQTAAANTIPSPSNTNVLTRIFKQVENSVVQIESLVSDSNSNIVVNGNPLGSQSTILGSGFVYDNRGHIVTTNDIIVSGAKTANVSFANADNFTAKVLGADPSNNIAVLEIADNFSNGKVVPLTIANSSSLRAGEQVIALGNPYGLSSAMTTGVVTQTGRLLPNPESRSQIANGIHTDVAANPGDSGGPLLNLRGEVVGMNVAILSSTGQSNGITFAVPSNTIARIIPKLIHNGTSTQP